MATTPEGRQEALETTTEAFAELVQTQTDLSEAMAEIERLQAIIESGEEIDLSLFSFVGACPSTTGQPADVPAKWGTPVSLRTFSSGAFNPASRPEGVDRWHHSWKPALGQPVTKAGIAVGLANAQDHDIFTTWHESDVKFRNGSFTKAQVDQAIAISKQFHTLIVEMREAGDIPMVETCDVYAAWMFDAASGLFPGTSADAKTAAYYLERHNSDLIGVDCDAYGSTKKYPDFTSVAKNTIASVSQHGRKGWTIPEWIHPRLSTDPEGTLRADWINDQGEMFLDSVPRPRGIMMFDTNYGGLTLVITPGSPEFNAVQVLMDNGRIKQEVTGMLNPTSFSSLRTWKRWLDK